MKSYFILLLLGTTLLISGCGASQNPSNPTSTSNTETTQKEKITKEASARYKAAQEALKKSGMSINDFKKLGQQLSGETLDKLNLKKITVQDISKIEVSTDLFSSSDYLREESNVYGKWKSFSFASNSLEKFDKNLNFKLIGAFTPDAVIIQKDQKFEKYIACASFGPWLAVQYSQKLKFYNLLTSQSVSRDFSSDLTIRNLYIPNVVNTDIKSIPSIVLLVETSWQTAPIIDGKKLDKESLYAIALDSKLKFKNAIKLPKDTSPLTSTNKYAILYNSDEKSTYLMSLDTLKLTKIENFIPKYGYEAPISVAIALPSDFSDDCKTVGNTDLYKRWLIVDDKKGWTVIELASYARKITPLPKSEKLALMQSDQLLSFHGEEYKKYRNLAFIPYSNLKFGSITKLDPMNFKDALQNLIVADIYELETNKVIVNIMFGKLLVATIKNSELTPEASGKVEDIAKLYYLGDNKFFSADAFGKMKTIKLSW